MFEEAEFNQAIEEMNCPKLEDWEFFVETFPEGVHCKIYRQYDQVCWASVNSFGKWYIVLLDAIRVFLEPSIRMELTPLPVIGGDVPDFFI